VAKIQYYSEQIERLDERYQAERSRLVAKRAAFLKAQTLLSSYPQAEGLLNECGVEIKETP